MDINDFENELGDIGGVKSARLIGFMIEKHAESRVVNTEILRTQCEILAHLTNKNADQICEAKLQRIDKYCDEMIADEVAEMTK